MSKQGTFSRKSLSAKEWHKELLLSWLFHTYFKLQVSLDRRFFPLGMTFQEAAVLMRCAQAAETTPGRLAIALARDKGKITRFIDRLEVTELIKRSVDPRDRRVSIIKATPKGKRLARAIATMFDQIREELFVGVLDRDIQRLSGMLPQLHKNVERLVSTSQPTRRIRAKKDHFAGRYRSNGRNESASGTIKRSADNQNDNGSEERNRLLAHVV